MQRMICSWYKCTIHWQRKNCVEHFSLKGANWTTHSWIHFISCEGCLAQIFCWITASLLSTSDSGANMIKAVYLLSDMQEGSLSKEVNGTDPMVTGMDENEIDEVHGEGPNLVIELDARTCVALRCSAHTLQLAIDNALKEQQSTNLISTKRRVAKKLCTPNVGTLLKRMGHKGVIVYCPIRWHSTHKMLEQLFWSFCKDMSLTPLKN